MLIFADADSGHFYSRRASYFFNSNLFLVEMFSSRKSGFRNEDAGSHEGDTGKTDDRINNARWGNPAGLIFLPKIHEVSPLPWLSYRGDFMKTSAENRGFCPFNCREGRTP